ncbi:MAG: ABC transporter substrate-binding protein [Dethiobacteraceae bacterium]
MIRKNLPAYIILILMVAIVALIITACSSEPTTVTDRMGNEVVLPEQVNSIISTSPANTEILVALGMGDKIVAVDKYSEGITGLNAEVVLIDFMNPDAETIVSLNPDIIIASEINTLGGSDPFAVLKEAGIPVVYQPLTDSIQGIYDDISFIAEITGSTEKAEVLIAGMQEEIAKYQEISAGITEKKRVYFEISPAPDLFTIGKGSYLQEMLEIVGVDNVFADLGKGTAISGEAVLEANPEIILTNVNYIDNPVEEIKSREGWDSITAVAQDQVYYIDSNTSSRATHNIVKALKEIAETVYPEFYE